MNLGAFKNIAKLFQNHISLHFEVIVKEIQNITTEIYNNEYWKKFPMYPYVLFISYGFPLFITA